MLTIILLKLGFSYWKKRSLRMIINKRVLLMNKNKKNKRLSKYLQRKRQRDIFLRKKSNKNTSIYRKIIIKRKFK